MTPNSFQQFKSTLSTIGKNLPQIAIITIIFAFILFGVSEVQNHLLSFLTIIIPVLASYYFYRLAFNLNSKKPNSSTEPLAFIGQNFRQMIWLYIILIWKITGPLIIAALLWIIPHTLTRAEIINPSPSIISIPNIIISTLAILGLINLIIQSIKLNQTLPAYCKSEKTTASEAIANSIKITNNKKAYILGRIIFIAIIAILINLPFQGTSQIMLYLTHLAASITTVISTFYFTEIHKDLTKSKTSTTP